MPLRRIAASPGLPPVSPLFSMEPSVSSPSASALPATTGFRLVFGAAVMSILLASLGQTIVTTALPIIVGDVGGLEHLSWAITSYLLAATVATPLYGKFGDMFGRKIVLQVGIVVFLAGSAVAAMVDSMVGLVIARVIQGLGAGGLIVVPMAMVSDTVAPRDRGKYQGMLGGVFGFSTVVGPLIGGLMVGQVSWRWLFLINLPIGLVALAIITLAFRQKIARQHHSIDVAGAVFLAMLLSALVLYTSLGGTVIDWISLEGGLILAIALAGLVGFILAERRAAEPIIPLHLFTNNAFVVSNTVGFVTGMAMFASLTFMPMFFQIVMGLSPMEAGLRLVPMMAGLIGTSNLAGIYVSRTGRYRILPILACAILIVGLLLLGTITPATNIWLISLYMFIIGAGIGPIMSVGVTAIQNAVPRAELGVGTASANMFRQIGGSLGVALFGAVFANRLSAEIARQVPAGTPVPTDLNIETIAQLSDPLRDLVLHAYAFALHPAFWMAAGAAAVGFVVSFFLREVTLSTQIGRSGEGVPAQ